MLRVPFDDLTVGDEQLMLWEDRPFSGIAFEIFPNGGLAGETEYSEGLMQGRSRTWNESGALMEEASHWAGARHGLIRSWHQVGTPRSEEMYQYGILVSEQRWDGSGSLLRDWRIGPDDPLFRVLELSRARGRSRAKPHSKPE